MYFFSEKTLVLSTTYHKIFLFAFEMIYRLFGSTRSKSQHQKQRIAQSFDSSDIAAEGTAINQAKVESVYKYWSTK